ncbi:MAG: sortase, partial [Propionibacteriaceae bacterium]|nr:sortase [Propionibacteriaceae bacterium]
KPKKQHGIATSIFLAIGMTCLVAGIGTLGWVAWELWGTNIGVRDEYVNQIGEMEDMWAEDPAAAPAADPGAGAPAGDDTAGPAPMIHYDLGRGFAILDIPKLGLRAPVLAGTDESSLSRGVGWEVYTSLPGQVGNFVVAGHHSSRGHPFDKLQSLVVGDRFTVETKDTIYTYEIFQSPGDLTVQFTDTWVTLPDPINRSTEATRKIATLVTCKEVFSTPLRSVGFAELVSETPKG